MNNGAEFQSKSFSIGGFQKLDDNSLRSEWPAKSNSNTFLDKNSEVISFEYDSKTNRLIKSEAEYNDFAEVENLLDTGLTPLLDWQNKMLRKRLKQVFKDEYGNELIIDPSVKLHFEAD